MRLKSLLNLCISILLIISGSLAFAGTQLCVGYEENPPIAFTDKTGKPTGLSINLLDHIARLEEWQITWKSCKWEKCLEGLNNGTIDLLVGIGHTKDREALYSFTTEPVMVNWGQLYSSKNTHFQPCWTSRESGLHLCQQIHTATPLLKCSSVLGSRYR